MHHADTWFSAAAVLTCAVVACGNDSSSNLATGGIAGSAVTAGTPGAGGSEPTGAPTGGASGAGGGAVPASGGMAVGGMAVGGAPGNTAGSTGAGATSAGSGGVAPTSGCNATSSPKTEPSYTIDVGGTPREFIVSLPANYSSSTPYRLVFAWHGRTGTAAQIARNFYGLKQRGEDSTIFVSGQGLGTDADPADTGWPNTDGRDVAFVRALIDWLGQNYCVDQTRIFSVGMSYGGIMSHTLGCQMGDVFRAIAPIAGAVFGGGRGAMPCKGPVAAWIAHGSADDVITPAQGESGRDLWLMQNGCGETSAATEPSPCVAYDGCGTGHPVHWCVHPGGHTVPNFTAEGVWNFFTQF